MKRNKGIITILVGIGILFISIFFSSYTRGSIPERNFIDNISKKEIVLVGGISILEQIRWQEKYGGTALEHVAIPLKYPLSFSVVLILVGSGIVLISKNK